LLSPAISSEGASSIRIHSLMMISSSMMIFSSVEHILEKVKPVMNQSFKSRRSIDSLSVYFNIALFIIDNSENFQRSMFRMFYFKERMRMLKSSFTFLTKIEV